MNSLEMHRAICCPQAMFNVDDIGPSDSGFLDNINLSEDFSQDTSYLAFTASNNGTVTSNYASAQEKPQMTGIRTTFLEEPLSLPNLIPHQGSIFETPGQILLNSQSQQFAPKISTPLSLQRLQNSTSSPILLNLLNSEGTSSSRSASSSTDTKKELTKK